MRLSTIALVAAFLLGKALEGCSAQNLIVNGDFEAGLSGWAGALAVFWGTSNTVSGRNVGEIFDRSKSPSFESVNQSIATTPNVTYEITFALRLPELVEYAPGAWYPVIGDSRGGPTTISVLWNDRTIGIFPVVDRDNWSFYSIDAVAEQSSTRVTFFNPSHISEAFLDDVSVTAVPEPASLSLILVGLGMVAGLRGLMRRKARAP
jgi:hypothetical protein